MKLLCNPAAVFRALGFRMDNSHHGHLVFFVPSAQYSGAPALKAFFRDLFIQSACSCMVLDCPCQAAGVAFESLLNVFLGLELKRSMMLCAVRMAYWTQSFFETYKVINPGKKSLMT